VSGCGEFRGEHGRERQQRDCRGLEELPAKCVPRDVQQKTPRREDAQARWVEDREHQQDQQSPLRMVSISGIFRIPDSARTDAAMAQNDSSAPVIHRRQGQVAARYSAAG
jgi:hypothetical protein